MPLMTFVLYTILLAQQEPNLWNIGSLSGNGVLGFVVIYLMTRTIPGIEAAHEKQQLQQRADLLVVAQKNLELSERVIQIFSDTQCITVKDNQDAIHSLAQKAEELRAAAADALRELREDKTIRDELTRTRDRLKEWELKHGSNSGRKRTDNPPT